MQKQLDFKTILLVYLNKNDERKRCRSEIRQEEKMARTRLTHQLISEVEASFAHWQTGPRE